MVRAGFFLDGHVAGCGTGMRSIIPMSCPEEHRMNTVLARLGNEDRTVVARMPELSYEGGIHDTFRVLNDHEVPPFDDAYEGTPFHDFLGRLKTDWEWPN